VANTLLTPNVIAKQALANLYETTVMAPLVWRDFSPEFAARVGDTITIRKPTIFTAEEFVQANGINIQNADEDPVTVTLNHFADVSFAVTAKELALDIQSFDQQLLTPAMEALVQKMDRDILAFRNDITNEVGGVAANPAGEDYNGYNGAYPYSDSRVLIEAGKELTLQNVPLNERRAVVGPTTSEKRGSTEGLLEASLGQRQAGFDGYETQNIEQPAGSPATGEPTTEVGVAFHKTAVALVTRPLEAAPGVETTVQSYKGLTIRVVRAYDINTKRTIVSLDCLYGVKTLDPNRAVLIKGVDA
jgi:hypothetical protein